jgi:hypothetical protein
VIGFWLIIGKARTNSFFRVTCGACAREANFMSRISIDAIERDFQSRSLTSRIDIADEVISGKFDKPKV